MLPKRRRISKYELDGVQYRKVEERRGSGRWVTVSDVPFAEREAPKKKRKRGRPRKKARKAPAKAPETGTTEATEGEGEG